MKMTDERWGSLFFLVTGVYGMVFSLQLPLGELSEPGPSMYPLALSVALIIFGLLLFYVGKGAVQEKEKVDWTDKVRNNWTKILILMIIAGFIIFLETLGYLLTSSLFIFTLLFLVSRYRIRFAICLALGVGAGSWLFFGKLLSVQFPAGILSFLTF